MTELDKTIITREYARKKRTTDMFLEKLLLVINGSRFSFPEAKTAAVKTSYLAALLLKRQNSYMRYSGKSADVAKLVANRMAGPYLAWGREHSCGCTTDYHRILQSPVVI